MRWTWRSDRSAWPIRAPGRIGRRSDEKNPSLFETTSGPLLGDTGETEGGHGAVGPMSRALTTL